MAATARTAAAPARDPLTRLAGALHRRPRLGLGLLLTAPLLWLCVLYLGSLAVLFVSAFWTTDSFTAAVVKVWSADNFHTLLTTPVYRQVTVRSIGVALAVTALCTVIALPLAFYTACVARPRLRPLLVVAVLTPLWASYLVKVYAWRLILSQGGLADWLLRPLGLSGPGFGLPAAVLTLTYLWLPYMVLPVHTALVRLPAGLLDASADLGARPWRTVRSVVLPLVLPSVAAGSVFTFSLSLGDYITVEIVGGKTQLIGNLVHSEIELDPPLAAALATVPVAVIVLYLLALRRTGALSGL
ncbi:MULTISPECIES: ABC transporter permease [unclassified Streptomyces]|uniref:ABC transporter permease n=1 Tax=unclassified Streptomyces TaxID=2593676 RepID=UPI0007DE2BE0|nr:ABC transporter permease [Streptomyces sp. SAT1]ANH94372.1 spermidine/putrescine ABC transporter permease [Streptomyces sp. SAT1]